MTPLDRYYAGVKAGQLDANSEQESVLSYLTQVQKNLIQRQKYRRSTLIKLILRIKAPAPVAGLYLWGGVGVGKTLIMDFFYETLPVPKLRLHFHAFMQRLHEELREWQGQVNPLRAIAARLAEQYSVICFDEFLVTNVADAMLLTELFQALFKGGVCLVTTANLPPERLYENGLQRPRFLPFIDLIHRHTRVHHLALQQDYRRRALEQMAAYYAPLGDEAEHALWHALQLFAEGQDLSQQPLSLFGREIAVKQRTDRVIWFEFSVICGRPRSQKDYLAIAEQYSVVLVSNVPCLETVSKDLLVSFIHLVDILYDTNRKLILSAAVPIAKLYTRGGFYSIFQRTESRLTEMQSQQYGHLLG